MRTRFSRSLVVVILFFAAANAAWAVTINEVKVDWANSYVLVGSGGLENPLLRVAFNPQPEPPAAGILSFVKPPNSAYPPDPVITHSGDFAEGSMFRLLFGVSSTSNLMIPEGGIVAGPKGSLLDFTVLNEDGVMEFAVQLELTTSSGGSSIDWVAFNPQPEPPALGGGAASFGADFSFDSFSDVSLAIRIQDSQGAPITLRQVPVPPPLLMLALGLALVVWSRRDLPKKS